MRAAPATAKAPNMAPFSSAAPKKSSSLKNPIVAGSAASVAAAAPLATNGVFAPLLLTDDPARLPPKLEEYFLSVQPGYEDDPAQAVYNRVWVLGDDRTVSVAAQGQLDELTELVPVQANAP